MMRAKKMAFVLASGALLLGTQARADNWAGTASDIGLLTGKDWQFFVGGFAEADMFNDSTQNLAEVVGDNPVKPSGVTALGNPTFAGSTGRTMFSIRNSRFDFTALAPSVLGWKDYGYMEFDLLGFDPLPPQSRGQSPANNGGLAPGTVNSQSGFVQNPTLRVRHMYAAATKGDWKVLIGQTWDLFGFSPDYVLDTISLSPVRGDLYERTPQFTVYNTIGNDTTKLQTAVSMEQPVQQDSEVPGLDAAMRLKFPGWTGAYSSGSSANIISAPASFAVSGKVNTFAVPNQSAGVNSVSSTSYTTGEAVAVTCLIPVIPAQSSGFLSSLVFTGEFSAGDGYGDEFSGWNGGESAFGYGGAAGLPGAANYVPGTPNLDAGQGGYYNNNTFHLINLQSFNLSFQYQLPDSWATYIDGGYSELYSDNMASMAQNSLNFGGNGASVAGNQAAKINLGAYNQVGGAYLNLYHNFTPQFRMGLEYSRFTTTYVLDHVYAFDNRYQLSAWFLL